MANPFTMTRQEYDEYTTKAMLLGRTYDWQSHSMWISKGHGEFDEVDADTLEPLGEGEVFARKDNGRRLPYTTSYPGMVEWRNDQQRGIEYVPIPDSC